MAAVVEEAHVEEEGRLQSPDAAVAVRSSFWTRKRLIIFNLSLVNLVCGVNFAVLAPFFPEEAAAKGVSTSMTGVIFAEFEFIICLTAPLFGVLLPRCGARFMYLAGIFLSGGCSVLFGLLGYCPPGFVFVLMSLLVRGVMALGVSMLVTASFTIIALSFPENVASMFGYLEMFSGMGLMLGPPLGGGLFQVGGFALPFTLTGTLLLLVFPFTWCLLHLENDTVAECGSFLRLLGSGHLLCVGAVLWAASFTIGFLDPILQPFLYRNFHLGEFLVGVVFFIGPVFYAVMSPVAGYLCEKLRMTKQMMAAGLLLLGVSMLLVNPSPLLHFGPPRLWITIVSFCLFGIAVGGAMVPSARDAVNECLFLGLPDDISTMSMSSGFINSMMSLGFFSGPLVSGILTDHVGFEWSTTINAFIMLSLGIGFAVYTYVFLYVCGGRHRTFSTMQDDEAERQPLLVSA